MRYEELSVGKLQVESVISGGGLSDPFIRGTGKKFYVDSVHGSDGNDGLSSETPLASVFGTVGAYSRATASHGDVIFCLPGHAETLTSSGLLNKIGLWLVGLGSGDLRPTFTINAAIPGINIRGASTLLYNIRIIAGASVTAATRLLRINANEAKIIGCRFEMAYDMYHMIVVFDGDDVMFDNCEFLNAVTTAASVHPQTGLLNLSAETIVQNSRFMDMNASKAERWRACVEGGKLTGILTVKSCTFVCRGVATATRSAAASGLQFTVDCRGISPSSNTSVGSIFTPTYQHCIETYNVAAVNKVGVVTVTTSDKRFKTGIVYL